MITGYWIRLQRFLSERRYLIETAMIHALYRWGIRLVEWSQRWQEKRGYGSITAPQRPTTLHRNYRRSTPRWSNRR